MPSKKSVDFLKCNIYWYMYTYIMGKATKKHLTNDR